MTDAAYIEKKRAAFCAVKKAMDMLVDVTEPKCGPALAFGLPKPPPPFTIPPPPSGPHPLNAPIANGVRKVSNMLNSSLANNATLFSAVNAKAASPAPQLPTNNSTVSTNVRATASPSQPEEDDEDSGNMGKPRGPPNFGMNGFTQSGKNIAASVKDRLNTQGSSRTMSQQPTPVRGAASAARGRAADANATARQAAKTDDLRKKATLGPQLKTVIESNEANSNSNSNAETTTPAPPKATAAPPRGSPPPNRKLRPLPPKQGSKSPSVPRPPPGPPPAKGRGRIPNAVPPPSGPPPPQPPPARRPPPGIPVQLPKPIPSPPPPTRKQGGGSRRTNRKTRRH